MSILSFHVGTTLFNFFKPVSELVFNECWFNDWLTEGINEEIENKWLSYKGQSYTASQPEYSACEKF